MSETKCDCDVDKLMEAYRVEPFWMKLIKWDDKHSWLFCDKHRVYIMVELSLAPKP